MDDNNTFDAEEFKKPKLKSILINLLITLAVAAVAFYVTLPAINIHSKDFYGFVFLILAVYIVLSLLTAGKTASQLRVLRFTISVKPVSCRRFFWFFWSSWCCWAYSPPRSFSAPMPTAN